MKTLYATCFFLLFYGGIISLQGQTTKPFTLSLAFGRTIYGTDKFERNETYHFGGTTSSGQSGYSGLKTKAVQIGLEYQISPRFSAVMELTGSMGQHHGFGETGGRINNVVYHGSFPREEDLRAISLQPVLLYDFLNKDRFKVKFGVGPSFVYSRLKYISNSEGYFDNNLKFVLTETSTTVRNAKGIGIASSLVCEFSITNTWKLFMKGAFNWYVADRFTLGTVGVGYSF